MTDAQVLAVFARERLTPERWENGPGAVYAVHEHPYAKVLVVQRGRITFTLPREDREVAMWPGDRLDLAARTPHSAVVGSEGVVCWEAHRRPSWNASSSSLWAVTPALML
jgi:quercetin dioxygenase-like cupin family protein